MIKNTIKNDTLYFNLKKNLNIVYLNNSSTEIIVRCPYCGDSIKSATHAHFYIENSEPYRYHCKRCSASGIFSYKTMKDLNFYDADIFKDIIRRDMNLKNSVEDNYKLQSKSINDKIKIPHQDINKWGYKLDYLKNRLGYDFDYKSVYDYKIILDFKKFFRYNNLIDVFEHIDYKTGKKFDFYNDMSIGFLSYDNSHIVFRSVKGTFYNSKRYDVFNLFPDLFDTSKRYVVKNKIDLMSKDEFNIIVTEGVIDLISVREHGLLNELPNKVYLAINGKDYYHSIQYIIMKGLLNNRIHIFSDSEIKINYYKKILKGLYTPNKINIYYNKMGEDFGVKDIDVELTVM